MRPTRAALLLTAATLAPALLLTTPAFGAESPGSTTSTTMTATSSDSGTPVDEMTEDELRAAIQGILANESSGRAVVREANEALNGTVEDMRAFLETGLRLAQAEDDRVEVSRLLYVATQNGDKAVIREANEALDAGTPEALRAFLETGYAIAQHEDDNIAVARLLYLATQNGDKAVIREANEALSAGTPEAVRAFRETGYRLAQAEDDAVYIVRMLANPDISEAMYDAIQAVLDDGSPEALRYFRTTGQYEVDN